MIRRLRLRPALGAVLVLCGANAALALTPHARAVDLTAERAAIEEYQALDQRLQDVGWRLARANADFCERAAPSVGLQLQDMASYGAPGIARAALGLKRDFAVQTAAKESPAGQAGMFAANREISLIGAADPNAWEAGERLDWRRLVRAHDHIDTALADAPSLSIAFADGETVELTPVKACATRFELSGDGERAVADGARVVIGARFYGFAYSQELFAAAVAHELAHNLLAHRVWLDANGRNRRNIRTTEREADRLMPWLLANAGYDPAAAAKFFREYQPSSGSAFLLRGSHDSWKKRADAAEAEVPRIRALMDQAGKADWSVHFKRLIEPAKQR